MDIVRFPPWNVRPASDGDFVGFVRVGKKNVPLRFPRQEAICTLLCGNRDRYPNRAQLFQRQPTRGVHR
jgi:hypothetical protein